MADEQWTDPAYDPPPEHGQRLGDRIAYRDVFVGQVPGFRPLFLDLLVPAGVRGPVPLLVWVHGGGWQTGSPKLLPAWLAPADPFGRALRAGFAVALPAYRLSGEAPFPAPLHDLKAAVRWLRRFASDLGLDPERFGAWGESAGGHLTALLALTGPALDGDIGVTGVSSAVQAAVDWYGPSDLAAMQRHAHPRGTIDHDADDSPESMLIGGPVTRSPELAAAASPISYATADAPPMLLLHGQEDLVVGHEQSVVLAEALRAVGAPVEFVSVPHADHLFAGADLHAQVRASLDFFAQTLKA